MAVNVSKILDILYTQKVDEKNTMVGYHFETKAQNVLYSYKSGDNTINTNVKEILDNIGTDLEQKFVTLNTEQIIRGQKEFISKESDYRIFINLNSTTDEKKGIGIEGITNAGYTYLTQNAIYHNTGNANIYKYEYPYVSGRLLTDGSLPKIVLSPTGSGNGVASLTLDPNAPNGHTILVHKDNFATTDVATESKDGLMSSTDKKNLDDMVTLFGTTAGDSDKVVNTVRELLALFDQYEEGATITEALAGKADKSSLDDYVKIDGSTIMTGTLTTNGDGFAVSSGSPTLYGNTSISVIGAGGVRYTLTIPKTKNGTIALKEDLPKIPESLPPTGDAGGDLTGTYPNPVIGTGKVTEGKIGAGAVTEGKIASDSVTTGKIKDGNVTNDKLDSIVEAGTGSVIEYNSKGRVTGSANLFTVGKSDTVPDTVPVGGFYLQDITPVA